MKPQAEDIQRKETASPTGLGLRDALILAALGVPTTLVCILVGGLIWEPGLTDELIGQGGWVWRFFVRPAPVSMAAPAIAFILFLMLALVFALRMGLKRRVDELIAVGLCLVISYGIIHHVAKTDPHGEAQPMGVAAMPWAGGYYGEAVRVDDMKAYLAGYDTMIEELRVDDIVRGHVADHPVGAVMFHWLVNRACEESPWLTRHFTPENTEQGASLYEGTMRLNRTRVTPGDFAGLWASGWLLLVAYWLSLIPIYLLGRTLWSKEAGLMALALAALVPALHCFSPYIDQIFVFCAAWGFWAWHRAVAKKSALWAAVASAVLFAGLMVSLSVLLAVALIGLGTLLVFWREWADKTQKLRWRGWTRVAAGGFGAFLVLSLIPTLVYDYDTWRVWKICLSQHAKFGELFKRSYVPWTLFNPVEFILFTGVPIAGLALAQAWGDLRQWQVQRRRAALPLLPWALIGLLVVANLSGKNLGEVARLWMFLMPFAALSAAPLLVKLDARRGWLAACVVALSAAQMIAFRLTLDVFGLFRLWPAQ